MRYARRLNCSAAMRVLPRSAEEVEDDVRPQLGAPLHRLLAKRDGLLSRMFVLLGVIPLHEPNIYHLAKISSMTPDCPLSTLWFNISFRFLSSLRSERLPIVP